MDLSRINYEVKRQILSKMNLSTIVRARKTNSCINSLVEKNGIVANITNSKLLLKISASPKINDLHHVTRKFELSFSVMTYNTECCALRVLLETKDLTGIRITDPVKQLSGVRFHEVLMLHDKLENNPRKERRINERKLRVFNQLPEILNQFKLLTDTLIVDSPKEPIPEWKQANHLITKHNLVCSFVEPIETIDEISIPFNGYVYSAFMMSVPTDIPHFIRHLKTVVFAFKKKINANEVHSFIRLFLMEIVVDRRIRGRLQGVLIKICSGEPPRLENFPGMVDIWHGVHTLFYPGEPATISKLKIDGGFAYLIYEYGYRMMFYNEEKDEKAIFNIKSQINLVERGQS